MSGGKYGGLDRASAESLLNGDIGRTARDTQLAGLLAAASGPAAAEELAGEQAVLAAFARSRRHRAGSTRRLRSRLAKLVASKTAAVVLVGSVAAGGAFATGGGVPIPFNPPSRGGGDVPSPSPATVSPHTATPEPEDEPGDGTATEEPDMLDQTPTPAPSTLPTESPTGWPTDSPTETVGDPSSSPQPTDDPGAPGEPGDDPGAEPEDPDTSAEGRPTARPTDGSRSSRDRRRTPRRAT
jgi:hypothetical protein